MKNKQEADRETIPPGFSFSNVSQAGITSLDAHTVTPGNVS